MSTSNDVDAYSRVGYAAKDFGAWNLRGSLVWTRVNNDVEQTLPGSMGLGKSEYRSPVGEALVFVPYASFRNVIVFSSNVRSKRGGSDAF